MYSISNRFSFENVEQYINQITRVNDSRTDNPDEREVLTEEGMLMARKFGCEFMKSSAATAVNVETAFYTVV